MKTILFLTIQLFSFISIAQTYKPFRVEPGFTIGYATEKSVGGLYGGYIEARYAANDQLLFGFRFEGNGVPSSSFEINSSIVEVNSTTISSTAFVSEYFFNNDRTRPFIGLSVGMYKKSVSGVSVGTTGIQIGGLDDPIRNFGIAPRIGINSGHFRLYANFNFTGTGITNYLGINMGIEIGGGPSN